jgi:hypothetical protein
MPGITTTKVGTDIPNSLQLQGSLLGEGEAFKLLRFTWKYRYLRQIRGEGQLLFERITAKCHLRAE